jgi:trigger factor
MNLMENSLKEAYEDVEKKPLPYATPVLQEDDKEVLIELDNDFTFAVVYDTMPDVKIGEYKGIEIESPVCKIMKKDVDRELETLREQNAVVVEKAEGKAAKGDIVNINYCELDDDGNEIADTKREDFVFTIGTGYNMFKLDDNVKGMEAGKEKKVKKEWAEDDEDKSLAGQKKKIWIKLNSIKVKDLPELDDELAQDISDEYKTLKDLKASIKKKLQESADNIVKERNKQNIIDAIIEKSEIDVPTSMVQSEMDSSWNSFVSQSRMPEETVLEIIAAQGKTKEDMLEEWKPAAEKNVKSFLITDKLIAEEKIEVTDEEVDEELKKQAEIAGMSYEDAKNYFEQNGMLFYLKNDISNRKLFDLLLKSAEIKDGEKKDYLDLTQNKE